MTQARTTANQSLVSTDWLAEHLDEPGLRIVDVRWYLDPARVIDRSTATEPQAPPEGIEYVFVNGQTVIEAGQPTRARPGRVLYGGGRSLPGDVRHEQPFHRAPVP